MKYLISKFLAGFVTLLGAIVLVAVLISFAPGSKTSPLQQFLAQMKMVFWLDFGRSSWNGLPVKDLIFDRLGTTLLLALGAVFFNIIIALPIGIFAGLHPNSMTAKTVSTLIYILSVTPVLVLGYVTILFLSLKFHLLITLNQFSQMHGFHKILIFIFPMLILAIGDGLTSNIVHTTKEEIQRLNQEPFMLAVRARNGSILKHLARNSLLPLYTTFVSKFSYLLGGAIIIEKIFDWKGFGYQTWAAAWNHDYPVILAATLIFGIIIFVADFSKEILTVIVNPATGNA